MSPSLRLRTAPAALVPGVVGLGALVAVGVAFTGYATGRLSTGGTFPLALFGLVVVGALTRRFGIALPGNGFASYVLGVTTFAVLERGWEFAAIVAPLLTVLGDVVLRRLPLRLAASNASHLTAGSALAGVIYEQVGGATGRWLRFVGVGWALLSASHGMFSMVADMQHLAPGDLSATDPRGFATFGLAGLWSIVLGLAIRSGASFPRTLGTIALVNGVDLLVLFFATATGAGTPVLVTGGLASVILGPLQWVGIGRAMIEA